MSLVWAAYVTIPLVTIVGSALLAYWVYAHQSNVRGARWFVTSLVLTCIWMALHLAMLHANEPDVRILAHELETKAATASFLTFALFASRYSRVDFHRHVLGKLAFGAMGFVLVLPTFLSPLNSVLYRYQGVVTHPFPYVTTQPGWLFVGVLAFALGLTGAGLFSLLRYLLSTPRNSGTQLVLLIMGALSIPLVTVVGAAGVFPAGEMNHATYGALGFALFTSLAIFRFQLFEMQPVARNAVVEHLQDPVFVLDGGYRLADYNEAATALVPETAKAAGTPFETVQPRLAEAMDEAVDAGSATRVTVPVDGRPHHYSVQVSVVGNETDPDWYSVVLRDVTDLERSRWQLAAQNERLDQVASTVSHDLRNPIQVADGFTDLLADRYEGADLDPDRAADIEQCIEKIRDSHGRMTDIIDDILTIAREGKTVEETEPVSLESVAEEAWDNVETADATLSVADDDTLQADRSKLLTVFENLFRNAVEHGPPDVAVEVGTTPTGFYVRDDGPGIPEGNRDDVFEYGFSTETNGTGLGLSIVETMAESHGWTVALENGYGDGTGFVFSTAGTVEATAGT